MDIEDIKAETAFMLAIRAECFCPDSLTSPGAMLLIGVRDAMVEAWEVGDVTEATVIEVADAAPDVYMYQRWLEFVDLGGWQEDLTEWGEVDGAQLTEAAGAALFMIAERLAESIKVDLETV